MIMCLMSMGFEYTDCQDAIQYGKVTVEEAVEWLFAGKPGFSTSAPKLTIRPEQPPSKPEAVSQPVGAEETPSISSTTATDSHSEEDSEPKVKSRYIVNEDQRRQKDRFHDKQREEARRSAIEERKQKKLEHQRVLQQIKEDKEYKANLGKQHTSETSPQKTTAAPVDNQKLQCDKDSTLIQIRLPNGQSIRSSFPATSALDAVWNFVCDEYKTMAGFSLMQPFPRHVFTREDMTSELKDLGLVPSGSLVLQKQESTQGLSIAAESIPSKIEGDEEEVSDILQPPLPPPQLGPGAGRDDADLALNHYWGAGHHLEENIEAEEQNEDQLMEEDMEDEEMNEDEQPGDLDFPGGLPGAPPWAGMNLHVPGQDQAPGLFAGAGQRLVPENQVGFQSQHHNRPAAEVVAEIAREKLSNVTPCNPMSRQQLTYNVFTLNNLCLQYTAKRINDPKNQILSLGGVSEDLAQNILHHLVKEKLLKPKSLQAFVPCYLRKLILDCYPFTTNELLYAVRMHVNLSHISLKSCPLITDSGLLPLTALKKLKILNLSSCNQITDKSMQVIVEFSNLVSLVLEETKVSDTGVIQLCEHCPKYLQILNLNRTNVSHAIFPHLKGLPSLKSLHLEQTQVCSLSGVQELKTLETLDIARTDIVTDSLLCLLNHQSITCLNICDTENMNGDTALQYVSGLPLKSLGLPSRFSTTNEGIRHISGFPLTSLDLTNYIHISDDGLQYVGQIHSLRKLLLSNTKITDSGMLFLEGLCNLEVLHLDRTLITDTGANIIKGFQNLEELSLCSTNVSSKFLCDGTLSNCKLLSKLNLSKTQITDKGIKCLFLPSLTLLNIDNTRVRPASTELLFAQCPNLKKVMQVHHNPVADDDMEEL